MSANVDRVEHAITETLNGMQLGERCPVQTELDSLRQSDPKHWNDNIKLFAQMTRNYEGFPHLAIEEAAHHPNGPVAACPPERGNGKSDDACPPGAPHRRQQPVDQPAPTYDTQAPSYDRAPQYSAPPVEAPPPPPPPPVYEAPYQQPRYDSAPPPPQPQYEGPQYQGSQYQAPRYAPTYEAPPPPPSPLANIGGAILGNLAVGVGAGAGLALTERLLGHGRGGVIGGYSPFNNFNRFNNSGYENYPPVNYAPNYPPVNYGPPPWERQQEQREEWRRERYIQQQQQRQYYGNNGGW